MKTDQLCSSNLMLRLVTVEVDYFAVLEMWATTVVGLIVQLTSAMTWDWLCGAIGNGCNAMTSAIF